MSAPTPPKSRAHRDFYQFQEPLSSHRFQCSSCYTDASLEMAKKAQTISVRTTKIIEIFYYQTLFTY